MKPQYINSFSVIKNGSGSEVIIAFNQQYAEQVGDKVEQKMDEVASIVMSPEVAMNLISVINKVVGIEYPPSK